MKKIISCAAIVAAIFGASSVYADDSSDLTFDLKTGFYSDYIFRGQKIYDDTSIQPQGTLTYDLGDVGALSADVWAHVAGDDNGDVNDANEVDYKLDYSLDVADGVSVSVGHIWYTYSDDIVADSAEYYASLGLDVLAKPTFTYYRDYDELDTNYFELGFSHDLEEVCGMGDGYKITPYATFGFTDENEVVYAESGLVQVTVGVSTDLQLGHVSVTPSFHYTFESDDTVNDQFWFGVTLGHIFEL